MLSATRWRWPRVDDPAFWARYWDDVRPRIVLLRVRVERVSIRWATPLWAFEETLRFLLLLLPWIGYAWRWLPRRWRDELARDDRRARFVIEPPAAVPWHALEALLDGHGEGLLRLPSGEPFVLVDVGSGSTHVHVEVTQV